MPLPYECKKADALLSWLCPTVALQPCRFSALTALTALRLDRNGSLAELPAAALSGLRHLSLLSLEGCRSLGALGPGAAELPLAWLNVKVRRRLWCFWGGGG